MKHIQWQTVYFNHDESLQDFGYWLSSEYVLLRTESEGVLWLSASQTYCISSRLRPLDVEFMKALHEKVNIVPVLAKADTLTPTEVKKKKIKASLILIYIFSISTRISLHEWMIMKHHPAVRT